MPAKILIRMSAQEIIGQNLINDEEALELLALVFVNGANEIIDLAVRNAWDGFNPPPVDASSLGDSIESAHLAILEIACQKWDEWLQANSERDEGAENQRTLSQIIYFLASRTIAQVCNALAYTPARLSPSINSSFINHSTDLLVWRFEDVTG